MHTIKLNDDLVDQVIKAGHYASAQEAVEAILLNYIQTSNPKTPFDQLCSDLNMEDDEVDALFERSQDTGRPVAGF
jgi:hypothetical protein